VTTRATSHTVRARRDSGACSENLVIDIHRTRDVVVV
jgi:hypothetical protein